MRARVGLRVVGAGLFLFCAKGVPAQSVPCGQGLELRLSAHAPLQGALVQVDVRAPSPVLSVGGTWAGQSLHFWQRGEGSFRALLGVDLQISAEKHPLSVEATLPGGERRGCAATLSVKDGGFAVERLTVDQRFVELSPKDSKRAQAEARRLRKVFASVSPARLWQAPFQPPLGGATGSGNFGKRRILNGRPRSPHNGEDFSAPKGTPVRAPQSGRVALAEDLFFSGKTVVLDHGLGLFTWYGHLDTISVAAGQAVETGTVLGSVGATGRVTGAHLHWAARLGRARFNPLDLLTLDP